MDVWACKDKCLYANKCVQTSMFIRGLLVDVFFVVVCLFWTLFQCKYGKNEMKVKSVK